MWIACILLMSGVVSCAGYGCRNRRLTTCQTIQKTIEFVRNQNCEGGGLDVITQGSYLPSSTDQSVAGEIVRQARNLSTLSTRDFNKCLPENYTQNFLCKSRVTDCGESDSYPTFDGSCNNLENPRWGSVGSEQVRLLQPAFDDGFNSARSVDHDDNALPNPRTLSNKIFKQEGDSEDSKLSLFVTAMAQLADHDITLTPTIKDRNGDNIDCCNLDPTDCAASCLPIQVPDNDYHFSKTGQTCINFVRSASSPCCSGQCKRTPMNMISSYIDANPTYGNSAEEAAGFRENGGTGAKLTVSDFEDEGSYLPRHPDQSKSCVDGTPNAVPHCVRSGDSRNQVVPFLTSIITMFHREHNRIVDRLTDINPHWDDERLYQEARKIVRALYQKIIIHDLFAGVVLDEATVEEYDLADAPGYTNVYDASINAQMTVAFTTAAMRFGHTTVPTFIGHYNKDNDDRTREDRLSEHFDRGELYFNSSGASSIMRYLGNKGMGKADRKISSSVRNNLFLMNDISLDLGSLNIMRGRDHGLPPYNEYRKLYGLEPFPADHEQDIVDKIREVYGDRDEEIDLFVGGLTETKKGDGLVGPLFAAIIGQQFERLKKGDRFYYTNQPDDKTQKGRFETEAQVKSIQDMTLARIICSNTETAKLQPNVFLKPSPGNEKIDCTNTTAIKDLNFWLWLETPA